MSEKPYDELTTSDSSDTPVNVPVKKERTLLVRTLSGAVYVFVNVVAIIMGAVPTALVMAITAGVCCWEFFRLMRVDGKSPFQTLGILFASAMPIIALSNMVYLIGVIFLMVMFLGIWYVVNPRARITDVAITVFGALYTGLTLSALVGLRCSSMLGYTAILDVNNPFSAVRHPLQLTDLGAVVICICVMASVWGNDAFAYLVGTKFGAHKLVPKISPKKSWEGLFGGIVGSVLIWLVMLFFPETGVTLPVAVLGGVVCGVSGVLGDLVESRIKRGAGVKDSGNFIPGHGGLLDRSDSMLFAAISSYFILRICGVI